MSSAGVIQKISFVGYSIAQENQLKSFIRHFWDNSATARDVLSRALNSNFQTLEVRNENDAYYSPKEHALAFGLGFAGGLGMVNQNGDFAAVSSERVFMHELVHALTGLGDNYNISTGYWTGQTVDVTNTIMRELGDSDMRASYLGLASSGAFAFGTSFSRGEAIEGALVDDGNLEAADTDDVLINVGAGSSILDGKGGNDFLHGLAGNDSLKGGDGDDFLSGGSGDDRLEGGGDDDTLSGGRGTDRAVFNDAHTDFKLTYDYRTGQITVVHRDVSFFETDLGTDTVLSDVEYLEFDTLLSSKVTVDRRDFVVKLGENANFMLVQDISGSFDDDLPILQAGVSGILGVVGSTFGSVNYHLSTLGSYGSYNGVISTTSISDIVNSYATLTASGDENERQLYAFQQAMSGNGLNLTTGIQNVAMIVTDEYYTERNSPTHYNVEATAAMMLATGTIPIFAVTTDVTHYYENLVSYLGWGAVISITEDSSNLTDATRIAMAELSGALTHKGTFRSDELVGTSGSDGMFGGLGHDKLVAGGGDDIVDGGANNDRLFGGSGSDHVTGGSGADFLYGEDGDDFLDGGTARDVLLGGEGADLIQGGDGNDLLRGENGNDRIFGNNHDDTIYAGAGDDFASGGSGHDLIYGEAGTDILYGGGAADVLSGGGGDDSLFGEAGYDYLEGGLGADRLFGHDGDDRLIGGAHDDLLVGGQGNDLLMGGGQDDKLFGSSGNDRLFGEHGNDTLLGDGGNDILVGGTGNDILSGGQGADFFRFTEGDQGDSIIDFEHGLDKIDLRGYGAVDDLSDITLYEVAGGTYLFLSGDDSVFVKGSSAGLIDSSDFFF